MFLKYQAMEDSLLLGAVLRLVMCCNYSVVCVLERAAAPKHNQIVKQSKTLCKCHVRMKLIKSTFCFH